MKKHIICRFYINIGTKRTHVRDFKCTIVDDLFVRQVKIDQLLARLEQVIKAALDFSIVLGVLYIIEVELLIDDGASPVHHQYRVYNPAAVLGFTENDLNVYSVSPKAAHRIDQANTLEAHRVTCIVMRNDLYDILSLHGLRWD